MCGLDPPTLLRTVPDALRSPAGNPGGSPTRRRRLPGEFELIARLCRGLRPGPRTILGPGDDCAIIEAGRAPQLFTIDSLVEGVHFQLEWGTPEALGARSLTVNLSDIAAMGGKAVACVVNLAVRDGLDARFFDRLYAGLRREASDSGVDIVGGNITRARELAITIALLGDAPARVLRRDAARAGDEIFVTGTVGDAAVGWRILAGELRARGNVRRYLANRFLKPTARLTAGQALSKLALSPAAIDISDGLLQDLGHILERSRVGAQIDPAAVPVSDEYRAVMGSDLSLALGGGEDYELLFCLRPGHSERELGRRLGLPVRRIGEIVRGRTVRLKGGRAPAIAGWDQLRSSE
ncbi:MAG TPA: thiamine-phosphate kinase [Candidatus Binataceae bacterium]|nr:thiamine-phosphate kinase [Candidatus Binataceae bacterium]